MLDVKNRETKLSFYSSLVSTNCLNLILVLLSIKYDSMYFIEAITSNHFTFKGVTKK